MVASRLILINETDSRPSVNSLHENFSGQSGRGVLHRGQAQNRPLLHVQRRPATESKGLGPLFLRREVVKELVAEQPDSTLAELQIRLAKESVNVSQSAISRFLHHINLTFKKKAYTRRNKIGPTLPRPVRVRPGTLSRIA